MYRHTIVKLSFQVICFMTCVLSMLTFEYLWFCFDIFECTEAANFHRVMY